MTDTTGLRQAAIGSQPSLAAGELKTIVPRDRFLGVVGAIPERPDPVPIPIRLPGTPNDRGDPPPPPEPGRGTSAPGFAPPPFGDPGLRGGRASAPMRDQREFFVYGFKDVVLLSRASGQSCTATFIHREWIVTAAHCVATWNQRAGTRLVDDWQGVRIYRVLEGPDTSWWDARGYVQPANLRNTPVMAPAVVHVHDQWTAGTAYDIAVVKLHPGSSDREPRMASISAEETVSTELTLAGFGDTTGATRHSKALEVGWQYGQFAEGLVHLTVLGGATNCLGDSGGPVFAGRQAGYSGERHVLVGIISARAVASGSEPCIGTLGYAVRLDRQDTRGWLCKVTDHAVDGCRVRGSRRDPGANARVSAHR
jgi:V8-like Glu-specific endopeptidase